MNHASLFSGIGGFDLAADRIGWNNVFHCEIDPFCQKVLAHHFPNSIPHDDITTLQAAKYFGRIDVLSGGFPCQDASVAKQDGQGRQGLEGDRTGLWTEMVRAIDEIRPRYIVAENVSNILRTNNGRDWRTILGALDGMGYNAEWRVTRASEVGSCHHRARGYLVAYPNSLRLQKGKSFFAHVLQAIPQKRRQLAGTPASVGVSWESEPRFCELDDGLPQELDGISFPKWRRESLKSYGNAIVPQIAHEIFKAIEAADRKTKTYR
tara:strand:- start:10366 stop:11160 length:795 start_codon:yes stop_codon:yes gene_type:complete